MTKLRALVGICMVLLIGVAYMYDMHHHIRFYATHSTPVSASADTDEQLVGEYYFGDGLGVNQSLTLHENGTFDCGWTGCLGDYGSSSGTWARDGDTLIVSTTKAEGMFVRSPLENMTVLQHDGKPHLLEESWRSFIDELGDDAIPYATFSPTQ